MQEQLAEEYKYHLVLVGNGLDINTGLHTAYKDFFSSLDESQMKVYQLISPIPIDSLSNEWMNLEKQLTNNVKHSFNPAHPGVSSGRFEDFCNYTVKMVRQFLYDYLVTEYQSLDKNNFSPMVAKYCQDADRIINFNYTNTLQDVYGINKSKIEFIHGSLDEHFIIIGMDNDEDVTNFPDGYNLLKKAYIRDILNFKRHYNLSKISENDNNYLKEFMKLNDRLYNYRNFMPDLMTSDNLQYWDDMDTRYSSMYKYFSNNNYEAWLSECHGDACKIMANCNSIPTPVLNYFVNYNFRSAKIIFNRSKDY